MLGKKSIYRRPVVILASLVVLLLLNIAVVNNPTFATRISDLTEQTEAVSDMSVDESNAQLADMADSMVAETIQEKDVPAETQQVMNAPEEDMSTKAQLKDGLRKFWLLTGFRNCKLGNIIMILVGILFIFLAVRFEFEPMLLIPIGTGIICGNIPFFQGHGISFTDAIANVQAMMDAGTLSSVMNVSMAAKYSG